MAFNDCFAYIPLFATAGACLIIFILLLIIKQRSTARVSFISFAADILVFAGSIFCAFQKIPDDAETTALFFISFCLFIAAFLILIYCAVLCTFSSKIIEKLSFNFQKGNQTEVVQPENVQKIAELSENDINLLNINRDFMVKAAEAFKSEDGITQLYNYINTSIVETIKADGGLLLMVDDFEDLMAVKSLTGDFPPPYKLPADLPHKPIRVSTNMKFATFPLRDNIFGEIATSGKAELITKPELDERIYQNGPEEFLECGSYLFIPIKAGDSVIGLLCLARKHGNTLFTEEDLTNASTLCDFAAASIKNVISVREIVEHSEITKEADIACRIQETLHPAKLPLLAGMQIGIYWNPEEGVCGDCYDIIPSRKDRISFMLCDVTGKGTTSMLIMIMIRAMLRLLVNTKQDSGTILTWANRGISGESSNTDHFASCALINYDPTAGKIEYAAGGTTPILLYEAATDSVKFINGSDGPIGVDKTFEYKNQVMDVHSGDIIVTYTDGLIETLNERGEQYGKDAVVNLIKINHGKSGKDIANLIKADVKKFCGSAAQHDDQTMLVVKVQ